MRFLAKEMRARDISLHFLLRSPNTSPPGILITAAAAAEEGDENVRAPRSSLAVAAGKLLVVRSSQMKTAALSDSFAPARSGINNPITAP